MKKIICLLVMSLVAIDIIYACECATPESPAIELSKAEAVFTGKVIKIDKSKYNESILNVKFKVLKAYKGISDEFIVVNTSYSGFSCGFPFVENEEYLIYASSREGILSTSICSRTKKLSEAREDLAELDVANILQQSPK